MRQPRVLVLGGGLVGAAAAVGLSQLGLPVTLADKREPHLSQGRLGVDARTVALSPASQQLLATLGVWDQVRKAPYARMKVWEQWGTSELDFCAAEVDREELGWIVENSPLLVALWQQLRKAAEAKIVVGEISQIEVGEPVVVRFADQTEAAYSFLVAADGAQSIVRKTLAVGVTQAPVDQVALASVARTEQPHQHTAWQRFLTDGPLALLPSVDPRVVSVIWSQSADQAERRMALSDDDLCAELSHASERCLGNVTALGERAVLPLTQQHVKSCTPHHRALLIGDAMRVVHPLAGLGVNIGLEDVRGVLDVARGLNGHVERLADGGRWRRFARERAQRSQSMIGLLAALRTTYAVDNPLGSLLRNIGISTLNRRPGIKQQIMREAMGLGPIARGGSARGG